TAARNTFRSRILLSNRPIAVVVVLPAWWCPASLADRHQGRRQSARQWPGRGQRFGLRVGDDAGRPLALDLVDDGVGSQAVGAVPVYERVATSAASDRIGSRRRDRGKASPWILTLRTP